MPRPSSAPKRWEGTGRWSHCHVVEYQSGLQLVNTELRSAKQRLPCSIETVAGHLLVSVADLPADLVAFLYPRDEDRGCSRRPQVHGAPLERVRDAGRVRQGQVRHGA